MTKFQKKLQVNNKQINVTFKITSKVGPMEAQIFQVKDKKISFISNSPSYIVINFIEFLKSDDKEINYIHRGPLSYWFFHDLAHALYTPDLFSPQIITIPREKEVETLKNGLKLAREAGLEEEYIKDIPQLKEENLV